MKCIHCATDSKYKERQGRQCPKCQHPFAMEPKDGDQLTDGAIKHVLDIAGSNGQVKFLAEHAYLAYCRRHPRWTMAWAPKSPVASWILAAVFTAVTFAAIAAEAPWFVVAVPGILALRFAKAGWDAVVSRAFAAGDAPDAAAPTLAQTALAYDQFGGYLVRYCRVHGRPKNLVGFPKEEVAQGPARAGVDANLFKEVGHYSFDRAVICDRADLVDVLVANDFHFENNCAILSFDGHPQRVFGTVRTMLRNNPKLVVLAVHDASVQGCRMAWMLRHHPDWFAKTARIVDVGLRPAHAAHFANQATEVVPQSEVAVGDGIDVGEARWLDRYRLSAAAILPEQLVKRLHAAFAQVESGASPGASPATSSDGVVVNISSDTGGDFESADSFG